MKHKKTLVAILLCIVLIFGMFALVACGKTDDGNNPDNNGGGGDGGTVEGILADYDAELLQNFEELIYKFFAYGQERFSFFTLSACLYSKEYYEYEDCMSDNYGNGWFGEIEFRAALGNTDTDPLDEFHMGTVCFYDSEENAEASLGIYYRMDSWLEEQYGNMLVDSGYLETKSFEEILASPVPSIVLPEKEQDYIDGIINEILHSNKTYHFLGFDCAILNEHFYDGEELTGNLFQFMTKTSSICNIYETYTSIPKSFENIGEGISNAYALNVSRDFLDIEEELYWIENGYYTDDSYLKLEDNTYYEYTKEKAGFVFTENEDDGYMLDYYYYTDKITSLIIPAENNGKSVTVIGFGALEDLRYLTSLTIPKCITEIEGCAFTDCIALVNITYQGTKAQWNAISKGNLWNAETGDYIVHCTDGDLDKNGNEI